ncbi:MAG: PAS domain-containing protein, partial [Acidobacteriota bacterium]
MQEANRTKGELINELREMRQRVAELEASEKERRRAEEELRESEEKYRTLIENVPQKIFLKDRNSVYVSCNENYASDLKIKPEEIAGKTDYDFYPKELAEKYRADDKRIIESGGTEDIEEKYIQEGQEVIVHTVKTPVKDEHGSAIGILGIFWDITEQKRAREKLRVSHRFLKIAAGEVGLVPLLKEFVAEVRKLTGCGAVGIRILDEEGNIPYQAYEGFSKKFYELESRLSIESDECMCINVVKGERDAGLPFCTEYGSFYTNGTSRFLATLSEEKKGRSRNVCNEVGYESVALVPIR